MDWDVPENLQATVPFGSMTENTTRWETLADNLQEPTITNVFSELMSDCIPNAEQNTEMRTAAEQLDSSLAGRYIWNSFYKNNSRCNDRLATHI